MGNVEFDDIYLDIIAAAKIDISRGVDSAARKKYLDILQKISSGKVTLYDDRFYLKPGTQAKLEFNLVAEGLRKIALLWQLIKNGTLEKGSVLFWDETDLFHIENSKIYKDLGSGIKTVEFVLKYDENSIVFLEAKKSCPNAANRNESKEKTEI